MTITPKLYVGTYAKYANGSIKGAWLELEGHDKASFLESCRELHSDEADPELMFQDFEGFPPAFYSESFVSEALFAYANLDEDDKRILAAYADAFDLEPEECTIENAHSALAGIADTEADFAENHTRDTEFISDGLSHWLDSCIDWQRVWNSALCYDFNRSGEFFFYKYH